MLATEIPFSTEFNSSTGVLIQSHRNPAWWLPSTSASLSAAAASLEPIFVALSHPKIAHPHPIMVQITNNRDVHGLHISKKNVRKQSSIKLLIASIKC